MGDYTERLRKRTGIAERLWAEYRDKVVPAGCSDVQMRETRSAFYAGMYAVQTELMRLLDPGAEPTDEDLAMYERLHRELEAFIAGDIQERMQRKYGGEHD